MKTSNYGSSLWPPALRIKNFDAHRAPLQHEKAGFYTDTIDLPAEEKLSFKFDENPTP